MRLIMTATAVAALICAGTVAMAQTSDLSKPASSAGTVTNGSQSVLPTPVQPKLAAPGSMSQQEQQRTGVAPTATNEANSPRPGTPGATGLPATGSTDHR